MYKVLNNILKWKGTYEQILNESFSNTLNWISSNNIKIYKELKWFQWILENSKWNITDINIKLKDFLKNKFTLNLEWIIHKWWGIRSFKSFHLIEEQINRIEQWKDVSFINISSISKVISFSNPRKYFIYDSRVVYVINWLLLKSDVKDKKYFKMPAWRNKKITFIDITTLLNVNKETLYYEKDFYYRYCDLIIKLHKQIFNDLDTFKTEMLLFAIADNYVYEDLISSIELKIKTID